MKVAKFLMLEKADRDSVRMVAGQIWDRVTLGHDELAAAGVIGDATHIGLQRDAHVERMLKLVDKLCEDAFALGREEPK